MPRLPGSIIHQEMRACCLKWQLTHQIIIHGIMWTRNFLPEKRDSYSNSGANSFNAGVELNWTLFDGGKMFITKNKLNEIQSLGEIEFKDQVLQTVFNVIVAYYEVVREKQQLVSINEVIK